MWLRNCWQVAAFAHEVIGGQLLARRICDEALVLFRASDGKAIAALSVPYITLVNSPQAPDITKTIALLQAAAEKLSQLAGSTFKPSK